MSAPKCFALAAFLLTCASTFAQSSLQPSGGLSTGGLQSGSLPRSWPFPPREPVATRIARAATAPGLAPIVRPAAPALEPLTPIQPDSGKLFFLLKPTSVETNDGIIAFKPGNKVYQQPDGSYLSSGIKLTLADNEVTGDPELIKKPAAPEPTTQPAPPPAAREPGHARIDATFDDFRRTPNLEWLGGSLFQLGSYSVMADFHDGRCQELTFADLVQDTVTNRVIRDARRSSGHYDKFFAAVLEANAGGSHWIEETGDPQNRKWRREDGALKAEATNTETNAGIITLTTTELAQHRKESATGIPRPVLEGL